jgi:hypothetical protein
MVLLSVLLVWGIVPLGVPFWGKGIRPAGDADGADFA